MSKSRPFLNEGGTILFLWDYLKLFVKGLSDLDVDDDKVAGQLGALVSHSLWGLSQCEVVRFIPGVQYNAEKYPDKWAVSEQPECTLVYGVVSSKLSSTVMHLCTWYWC